MSNNIKDILADILMTILILFIPAVIIGGIVYGHNTNPMDVSCSNVSSESQAKVCVEYLKLRECR